MFCRTDKRDDLLIFLTQVGFDLTAATSASSATSTRKDKAVAVAKGKAGNRKTRTAVNAGAAPSAADDIPANMAKLPATTCAAKLRTKTIKLFNDMVASRAKAIALINSFEAQQRSEMEEIAQQEGSTIDDVLKERVPPVAEAATPKLFKL